MEKEMIKTTETIEQLFENYKASHNEETPQTREQATATEEFEQIMFSAQGTDITQPAYSKAIELSRASEKAGFILGFKMAMNLMCECMG